MASDCNSGSMSADTGDSHDDVVRRSFERQVGLFSGPDSPFARRAAGTLAWLEPLDRRHGRARRRVRGRACVRGRRASRPSSRGHRPHGPRCSSSAPPGSERLGSRTSCSRKGTPRRCRSSTARSTSCSAGPRSTTSANPQRAVAEMVRTCRPGGRVVLSDLLAPSADERDAFDHLHQLIDPSHVRAFLEEELPDVFPGHADLDLRRDHDRSTPDRHRADRPIRARDRVRGVTRRPGGGDPPASTRTKRTGRSSSRSGTASSTGRATARLSAVPAPSVVGGDARRGR